jgi:hypothetical protein
LGHDASPEFVTTWSYIGECFYYRLVKGGETFGSRRVTHNPNLFHFKDDTGSVASVVP